MFLWWEPCILDCNFYNDVKILLASYILVIEFGYILSIGLI